MVSLLLGRLLGRSCPDRLRPVPQAVAAPRPPDLSGFWNLDMKSAARSGS